MTSEKLKVMKELYRKIKDGKASEQEKRRFDTMIATSCMIDNELLKLIEEETE